MDLIQTIRRFRAAGGRARGQVGAVGYHCAARIAVPALLSVLGAGVATSRGAGHDRTLLWFKGKPVYVGQMAGMSYGRGLRICKAAFAHAKGDKPQPTSWMLPAAGGWLLPGNPAKRGLSLYLHELQGVLDIYVQYKVLRAFEKEYHPEMAKYVRLGLVNRYVREQAMYWPRFPAAVVLRALARHWTAKQFLRAAAATMHLKRWNNLHYWQEVQRDPGFFVAVFEAFSPWDARRREATLWQRDYDYCCLANIAVAVVMERRIAFFVRMTNMHMGTLGYFAVTGVDGDKGTLAAMKSLINAVSSPAGKVAMRRLWEAQRCLQALGSRAAMAGGRGPVGNIRSSFGIPDSDIRTRRFMEARAKKGQPHCYVYVYQKNPSPGVGLTETKIANSKMRTFVFGYGEDFLLRPIAKRVLREIKPGLGLKLPAVSWVLSYANSDVGFYTYTPAGPKLPQVIIRRPWLDR